MFVSQIYSINNYIRQQVLPAGEAIPADRQAILEQLASAIQTQLQQNAHADVIFICTHNSRRSQLAQVWATVAAHWHDIQNISFYSGGTEATAFHPNAVQALQRAGLAIDQTDGDNPVYTVRWSDETEGITCTSKRFDDKANPQQDYLAVMTCAEADESCPFVPGAAQRIRLTYQDPKEADGTAHDQQTYDERSLQIAAELFWVMNRLNV